MNDNTADPITTVRNVAVKVLPREHERVDALADQARSLDTEARAFVRRNPVATVASALLVGFVLGRVFRG